MPKAYPEEFRSNVVAPARKREITWTQIAKDFGISEAAVHNWVKKADIAEGLASAPAASKSAELREARKRIQDGASGVTDEIWNAAAKHFDENQLSAIILKTAMTNFFNRINRTINEQAGKIL